MDAALDKTIEAGASRDLDHGISFGEAFRNINNEGHHAYH